MIRKAVCITVLLSTLLILFTGCAPPEAPVPTEDVQMEELPPEATATDKPLPTDTETPIPSSTSTPPPTATITETPPPTATITLTPTVTPTLSEGWEISEIDGMVLVYVPEGEFIMGSDEGAENEMPVHTVYLDAYWIDQKEVSNGMFVAFLNEVGNKAEDGSSFLKVSSSYIRIDESDSTWTVESGYANHPVNYVNWFGASAYCDWVGRRLPTEAEWEKAARGTNGWTYPWGMNVPNNSQLNYNPEFREIGEVGSFPDGASPFGALDMGGNVTEWVTDWYGWQYYSNSPESNPTGPESGSERVGRGGSFFRAGDPYFLRSTFRGMGDPSGKWEITGIRCATSLVP